MFSLCSLLERRAFKVLHRHGGGGGGDGEDLPVAASAFGSQTKAGGDSKELLGSLWGQLQKSVIAFFKIRCEILIDSNSEFRRC